MIFETSNSLDIPTDQDLFTFFYDTSYARSRFASFVDGRTGETYQYPELRSRAEYISSALLREYGLTPGGRVCLLGNNSHKYPAAVWSVLRSGLTAVGVNQSYNHDELVFALRTAQVQCRSY